MEEACGVEKWFSIPFLLVKKHLCAKVKALEYFDRQWTRLFGGKEASLKR